MAERIHEHEEAVASIPHPFVEEIDFNEIRQLEVSIFCLLKLINGKSNAPHKIHSSLSISCCVRDSYQLPYIWDVIVILLTFFGQCEQ